ncbi:MAG: DegT/DnrJ/EryC1/StrS family aminotransferase, partial [Deltaproteobacteria bacterium]|nr:DegT/DnrJ/EryC1/StrS family aminotransferase [Deltaproteobacteria bacterium]
MNVPFLDLKVQYQQIKNDVLPMMTQAMENGMFIGGPQVEAFEKEFAAFCEARFCVGLNSGTDALRFALMAAGVGPGDAVITVPNTFIATTEAISQTGAVPVFVDIDPATCNMDPSKLEAYLKNPRVPSTLNPAPRPKAVIPVHLYGQPADMDPILDLAAKHGLLVIEDACQAHGATYKGKKAGSMALAG